MVPQEEYAMRDDPPDYLDMIMPTDPWNVNAWADNDPPPPTGEPTMHYVKKVRGVEAIRLVDRVHEHLTMNVAIWPDWFVNALAAGKIFRNQHGDLTVYQMGGAARVMRGDWVVCHEYGTVTACSARDFAETYAPCTKENA
jgi:hypothetical protein